MSECVKLVCGECENIECPSARKYIPSESREGCIRKLDDDLYIRYEHYINEVLPFMFKKTTREYQSRTYQEIIDMLGEVYASPAVKKTDVRGKVLPTSWRKKQ